MEVTERWVSMPEIVKAEKEGRVRKIYFELASRTLLHFFLQLVESFGAGTAAIVSPVCAIGYGGRDIQIPVEGDSASMVGRSSGKSVAELVRDKILDIQVTILTCRLS